MSLRRVLAAGLVSALAATSCASNGGETATAATTDATGTTAAIGPTVAGGSASVGGGQAGNAQGGATTTSTTALPATVATVGTTTRPPATVATLPPDAGVVVPVESNCSPGPGALADGLYFGFAVEGFDDGLQFDLACWFTGEPAIQAATEDGGESPPSNDYWIRNANLTERTVPVSNLGLPVLWLYNQGGPDTELITYNEWLSERGTGYVPPIWITVEGGQLASIVEQYLP